MINLGTIYLKQIKYVIKIAYLRANSEHLIVLFR